MSRRKANLVVRTIGVVAIGLTLAACAFSKKEPTLEPPTRAVPIQSERREPKPLSLESRVQEEKPPKAESGVGPDPPEDLDLWYSRLGPDATRERVEEATNLIKYYIDAGLLDGIDELLESSNPYVRFSATSAIEFLSNEQDMSQFFSEMEQRLSDELLVREAALDYFVNLASQGKDISEAVPEIRELLEQEGADRLFLQKIQSAHALTLHYINGQNWEEVNNLLRSQYNDGRRGAILSLNVSAIGGINISPALSALKEIFYFGSETDQKDALEALSSFYVKTRNREAALELIERINRMSDSEHKNKLFSIAENLLDEIDITPSSQE